MNILFLSLLDINSFEDENIYMDLLNEFIKKKYNVFIVSPNERRNKKKTYIIENGNSKILKVKIGNIQKTNLIEKGISTVLIETQFKKAIKKHLKGIKFDLILYATPPITFCNTIRYFKQRDNAKTYLMLKDIFPQNAVDLGMLSKRGLMYKFFKKKERELYRISDFIGCMSQANVDYLLNNSTVRKDKVHILPNTINPKKIKEIKKNEKIEFRKKYNIPKKSKVFIYGGNLGKPQGIDFIIKCLDDNKNIDDRFFIICGSGTEYSKLEKYVSKNKLNNVLLINGLPKIEYEKLLKFSDVGLIFLDYKFTVPNFPSRILSYMEYCLPVLTCTDRNTDIGDFVELNNFGWKCYSNSSAYVKKQIDLICGFSDDFIKELGRNGNSFLLKKLTSDNSCEIIIDNLNAKNKK